MTGTSECILDVGTSASVAECPVCGLGPCKAENRGERGWTSIDLDAATINRGRAKSVLTIALRDIEHLSAEIERLKGLVPPTHALVPREPTTTMLAAGQSAWLDDPQRRSSTLFKAMVAAATAPPANVEGFITQDGTKIR